MVSIRLAAKDRTVDIKRLIEYTWFDTYKNILSNEYIKRITEYFYINCLVDRIDSPVVLSLVALDENSTIVGHALALNENNIHVCIESLYVLPEYQREGTGTKLLSAILDSFAFVDVIYLRVKEDDFKSLNFFKKNGFLEVRSGVEKIENMPIQYITLQMILNSVSCKM